MSTINRTSVSWRVALDDAAATDVSLLLAKITEAKIGLNAGSRALGSKFPPLFKDVADTLASSDGTPSALVLVSDGVLRKPSHWPNYAQLKGKLLERLGDAAPKIICYRTTGESNTKFFDDVCDSTFYSGGASGKTMAEAVADLAAEICSL